LIPFFREGLLFDEIATLDVLFKKVVEVFNGRRESGKCYGYTVLRSKQITIVINKVTPKITMQEKLLLYTVKEISVIYLT
jgi:hypothetical protein